MKGVKPTSYVDALALQHDIAYLSSGEQFASDFEAAYRADNSVQGILMRIGLLSRSAIDAITHVIPFLPNFHLNNSEEVSKEVIHELKHRANSLTEQYDLLYDLDEDDHLSVSIEMV